MNIKYLFILLLICVGFAACSSDHKDGLDIPENGKALLNIQLSPQSGKTMRATTQVESWRSESRINSYIILICDANDRIQDRLTGSKEEVVEVTKYRIGTSLRIYAFVNLSDQLQKLIPAVGTTLNLAALTVDLTDQRVDGLTMGSTAVTSLTLQATNNVTVLLTRYVSRIQISSIATKFTIANDYTVEINSLQVDHVKEASYLFNTVQEVPNVVGNNPYDMIIGWNADQYQTISNSKSLIFGQNMDKLEIGQYPVPYRYVFENTDEEALTQLRLRATLKDAEKAVVATRDFVVTINAADATDQYVKRNYIYDLGLTFTDASFDMASLVVKVTVVPWGSVKQDTVVD